MQDPILAHTALTEFARTVALYQEISISSGGLKAIEYDKGAESGKATNTGSSQTIQPSHSDFICDVELSARRCLTSGELAYFTLYYKSGQVVVQTPEQCEDGDEHFEAHVHTFPQHQHAAVRSLDARTREKLGRHLIEVGISPTSKYMKAVDVRDKRPPKIRWSHLY